MQDMLSYLILVLSMLVATLSTTNPPYIESDLAKPKRHPPEVLLALSIVLFNFRRDWFVRQRSQPKGMAALTGRVVQGLRVVRDTLVPDQDSACLVAHAALEVLALGDVVK